MPRAIALSVPVLVSRAGERLRPLIAMRDGLPEPKDFPARLGGSGESVPQ
ncbi:MAG: hypothetical protein WA864_02125 [Acetobacteraceae bacterium]